MRSTFAVRETQSLGQQMLNATVGINGLNHRLAIGLQSVSFSGPTEWNKLLSSITLDSQLLDGLQINESLIY